ncbi:MAG TPA: OmpA family protein [Kofleriaceae bacterium]|nr:OmpA family protein [Kofleriaceae bacterium]
MHRALIVALVVATPALAHADPTDVGGFFGPRFYSQISGLGYLDDAPAHPMLQNSIALGGRIAHQFMFPWLYPEFELALAPAHTNALDGASSVSVFWFEPRVQIRFELLPGRRVMPFVLIGTGAPVALSSARRTFDSGITGDGYAGAGVRFDTGRGFRFRFDARLVLLPGVQASTGDNKLGFEGDINFGVELALGAHRAAAAKEVVPDATPSDRDGDGIPDAVDKCPDRPEDFDGFEDQDGCPDIDNDGDHVLDIADKCPMQPETYNGFEDEDGCPDTVPADVEAIKGTIEGLLYAEGETAVHDSALPALKKIAGVMKAHPGIKIVLVGHTDDREAKEFAPPPAPGQPPPDLASLATDLSRARAEAVRQALVAIGVGVGRIVVDGMGAEEPVADNANGRGRLANRRVELKLFIPRP